MKKNFPTSMIAVAAVVAFGMVGSQLELGGLSGQAAGGESAGCGGDAYYDEDLGALVDSEGNILDENGESGAAEAPGDEFFNFEIAVEAAGEPMPGQNLVTIIRPNAELADDLQTEAGLFHEVRVAVSDEGQYAVINYIATDYEGLNETRLLRWSGTEWETVFGLMAERGEKLTLKTPTIVHVGMDDPEVGENVVFSLGTPELMQYRADDGAIRVVNDSVSEEINAAMTDLYGEADPEADVRNLIQRLNVRSFVERGLEHPWLDAFVEDNFGSDVVWNLNTSFNNRLLVSLSTGDILAIDACQTGNQPINAGGELVCASCNEAAGGDCSNVLNKVDALDISLDALLAAGEATYNLVQANNMLRSQPRLALNLHFATEEGMKSRCVGNNSDCAHSYDAAKRIYDCSGRSSCDGWTGTVAANDYAMTKGCVVAIQGSSPSEWQDWVGSNGNFNFFSNGIYHGGFLNAVDNLKNAGLTAPCGNDTTWIGHSRGGALASIFAQQFGGRVYTYGAPPAFSADIGNLSGYRFHSDDDPVPDMMHSVFIGGKHNVSNSYSRTYECTKRHWWGGCKQSKHKRKTRGVEHNDRWWSLYYGGWIGIAHLGYRAATNHVNDYHNARWD